MCCVSSPCCPFCCSAQSFAHCLCGDDGGCLMSAFILLIVMVVAIHCHRGRSLKNKHLVIKEKVKFERKKKNILKAQASVILSPAISFVCIVTMVPVAIHCRGSCKSSLNVGY